MLKRVYVRVVRADKVYKLVVKSVFVPSEWSGGYNLQFELGTTFRRSNGAGVRLMLVGTPFLGPPFLQSGVPRPQSALFSVGTYVPRPER